MSKHRILDGHVHVFGGTRSVEDMLRLQKEFGYIASNYLSCECVPGHGAQNALGIYLKAIAPENYIFGGLHHRFEYDYDEEAATLFEIGFDGMKLIDNKPTVRKRLGIPTNAPSYDGFYAFMEKCGRPIVAHVADPEECWDRALIPDWSFEAGYYYGDGSFIPKETLYTETLDVIVRYPALNLTLAHLFFMSAELERLDELMSENPKLCLDIVAGTEMYWNFAKSPDEWRGFFIKYQDRIIYGTDNMNINDDISLENARITNRLEQEFLTASGRIGAWDKFTVGIELPHEVCEKIFRKNFRRIVGETPNPLNREAAARYLKNRLADTRFSLTDEECEITAEVLAAIEG